MSWDSIWDTAFLEAIGETEAKSGTNPVDWRVSGRATKQWPDKENKAWWDVNGKEMFYNFITNWQESGFQVWVAPDGVPGIEIGFNSYFGNVLIKAYADCVATRGDEFAVIDFKTGKYTPDSSMQLGIYASLIEMQFGKRPNAGYYYSAREGVFKEAYGIDRWTIPVLTNLFEKFEFAVQNEVFLPNVGMSCGTCGVRDYCYAVGGHMSEFYDKLSNPLEGESDGSSTNN